MSNILTSEELGKIKANILFADSSVRKCARRHEIGDYIPGQVIYNLGEYPAAFSIRPTDYDRELIKKLAERGVGLIQIHEEWNDSMRRLGADKFTSHDPKGLREFIDLCHSCGIKVIPYISTGFFDSRDPDFSEDFAPFGKYELNSAYYRYRMCDPASRRWREYLIPRIRRILDDYGFDGLFNDMGYPVDYEKHGSGYLDYDPALDELLCEIYDEVHSRGGIVKIHEGKCLCPRTSGRSYDYIWVGEGCRSSEPLSETVEFSPYVVPCPDFRFLDGREEDAFLANAMVFMQFGLRVDGRPITGERADVPGVEYIYNPQNDEKLHFDKVKSWYEAHPDGPHVYSEWSKIPDDPDVRDRWFDYLDMYRPMVERGSVAYIDVTDSSLSEPLPQGTRMTLFVNTDRYLVLTNFASADARVSLKAEWIDRQSGALIKDLTVGAGQTVLLRWKNDR